MQEVAFRPRSHPGDTDSDTDGIGNEAHQQGHTEVEEGVAIDYRPNEHGKETDDTSCHQEHFLNTSPRCICDGKHDNPAHQRPRNPIDQERVGIQM